MSIYLFWGVIWGQKKGQPIMADSCTLLMTEVVGWETDTMAPLQNITVPFQLQMG